MVEQNGTQRDIGRLEAEVASLSEDIKELKSQVRINTQILTEMQGGKKYLFALFGLAAAIGAVADRILGWIH